MKRTLTIATFLISSIAYVALGGKPFEQLSVAEKMQLVHVPGVEEQEKRLIEGNITKCFLKLLQAWVEAKDLPIENAIDLIEGKTGQFKGLLMAFKGIGTEEAQTIMIRKWLRKVTKDWDLKRVQFIREWLTVLVEHASMLARNTNDVPAFKAIMEVKFWLNKVEEKLVLQDKSTVRLQRRGDIAKST